jgi:hypothetical protein
MVFSFWRKEPIIIKGSGAAIAAEAERVPACEHD